MGLGGRNALGNGSELHRVPQLGDEWSAECRWWKCFVHLHHPPPGPGNITNAPQFVDAANSNFHLLSTSPCIDAGTNEAWMTGTTDLDGHQRIINSRVDMGAYESLSPAISAIARAADDVVITWHSVSNLEYSVYGSTNVADGFSVLLQDGLPGTPPFNVVTDAVDGVERRGYAVEVREAP